MVFFQVLIPFLIAGFGSVGAGLVLDTSQDWDVFRETPELFFLIASFIGFKGSLGVALAARISTITNLGDIDNRTALVNVTLGNICLVQAQAIVLAILAALIAITISYLREFIYEPESWLLIVTVSITTASLVGLILPIMTILVAVFARKVGINPDNVSSLIVTFTVDLSTVIILCFSSHVFFVYRSSTWLEPTVVIVACAISLPLCLTTAYRNEYTREIVLKGWPPIIAATFISSIAGIVFDFAAHKYHKMALFQTIMSGVGSNLAAVHASRISTHLHLYSEMGSLPFDHPNQPSIKSPWKAMTGTG